MEKTRRFAGLEVSLTTGSKRKQTLSNRLSVRIPGDRTDVAINLTLRQAQALQRFLNENLSQ